MSQKLWLYTSNLSTSNLLTLKVFLGLTKNDEVAAWEHTENSDIAAAILIDIETQQGSLELKERASKGSRQALIAFGGAQGSENILALPRPLRLAELIPVLQQAARRFLGITENQSAAGRPTVRVATAEPVSRASFQRTDTSKVLRVFETLSKNQDKNLKITSRITRPIIFDFARRRYYVSTSIQSEVEDLLASPVSDVQIEEMSASQLSKEIQNLSAQDLDVPLWTAALAVSKGELFDGLGRDESFRLNRWPDLKKLGQNPLHMKLTALLRRGGTVDYLADFLKAPPDEIIAFVNACYILNYLVHEKKAVVSENKPSEQHGISASKRGLLSRIRSRLGI